MRQYQKCGTVMTVLLCLLLLAGCGKEKEPEKGDTFICYVDAEGISLVKRAYDVQEEDPKAQISEYLKAMQEEPDSIEYKSVFTDNAEIQSWELSDGGILNLYFGSNYRKMKRGEEVLFRAAVVQTLTQTKGVDYVSFYVDGQPLQDGDGREIGYMCSDDFVQNTGSSLYSYQRTDLKLYFANEKGNMLVSEQVTVRYNSTMSKEKLIVEQLIKGPSAEDENPVIPSETKVLGISVKDGICYVNLDDGFLNNTYGMDPKITVYAIVNSIVDGGSSSQVQILVNGESNIRYMGSVDLSKPLSRDLDLVY